MRSVRGIGTWTDESGGERGAVVEIAVDSGEAMVTIGSISDPASDYLFTGDRRIAYYLGRVESKIRAVEYRSRSITPDPKPKDRPKRRRGPVRP